MADAAGYPPELRVAIVGTGGISRTHGRRARDLGAQVVAVCGRRLASARALAAELAPPEPRAYDDLGALLREARPELLHVCSPHGLHAEQAEAALLAGVHVLCEKPLATSVAAAARLCDVAAGTDLVAACALTKRTYPMVAELRARVAAGGFLGALRAVRGAYLSWDTLDDLWRWGFDPAVAGPSYAMADLGVHYLDLVEHVTGRRLVSLQAAFSTHQRLRRDGDAERAVALEDYARLLFELEGGAVGSGDVTGLAPGCPNRLEISVDGELAGLDWCEEVANELVHRPGRDPVSRVLRDPDRLAPAAAALAGTPSGHLEGFSDAFRLLFDAVYRAVGGQQHRPYPTFADGHRAAVLVDAAVRSAAAARPVDVLA